jgi:murein DD-endopeptidase MepM/ murein hydrolase activator NlpD
MRAFVLFIAVIAAAVGGLLWWLKFEHGAPTATIAPDVAVVGREAAWTVAVDASGTPGLRKVEVRLGSNGKTVELLRQEFPAASWLGSGVASSTFAVAGDLGGRGVSEGEWTLQVVVDTYAWRVIPRRQHVLAERRVTVDLTPPNAALLTTQHNLRLGGAAAALFRLDADASAAGVRVQDYFFPAVHGYFADPDVVLALFAVPQDLSTDAQPVVRVVDAAGNAREIALPSRIRPRTFRSRTLEIDDAFLGRKVPELYALAGQQAPADLVQGYLYVNREMRQESERRIRAATAVSAPRRLWDGAFRRQSNSAPMSNFADRRTYTHGGETIDRQTHLGFDLASVPAAPVEAAQNGVVVLAEMLGIYGNTVILDHGLGVFTLYGHLSTFAVAKGDHVSAGQTVGQTGDTGLAGGDHLHFSVMLYGIHIDPVEWWDPKWLADHVMEKLAMFPAAGKEPAPPAAENEDGEARS